MQAQIDKNTNKPFIYWSAISAGVILTIAAATIFNLLGIGSGFTVLTFTIPHATTFTASSFIWLLISTAVALFVGAWLTGMLIKNYTYRLMAILHGVIIWAVTTIIFFISILSGTGLFISGISSTAANSLHALKAIQPQINLEANISNESFESMKNTLSEKMQNLQISSESANKLVHSIKNYLTSDDYTEKQNLRRQISKELSEHSNMTSEEVNNQLATWERTYKQLHEQAKSQLQENAKQASKALASIFMSLFFINLISLIAAVSGSIMGRRTIIKTVTE